MKRWSITDGDTDADVWNDPDGNFVRYDDVQAALTEKDARIKVLEESVKWETLCHLQQQLAAKDQEIARVKEELVVKQQTNELLVNTINKQEQQLDTLLGKAVWAMEKVQHEAHYWEAKAVELELDHPFVLEQLKRNETYQHATAFLARPDVQAWQARQKEKL